MVPFARSIISDRGLAGLKDYRYSGTDLSLTSKYIMQPYWRWSVNFLPRTMAPNLVTLVGFSMLMLSYTVTTAYSPDLRQAAPTWVWLLAAVCVFGYQTLDALDGKQARRTGTSSPLGELFDHGCDAMGTHLIALCTMAALMLPEEYNTWALVYVLMMSSGFYFCAWEQYHTGTLTLGYINGPVEGILLLVAIFLGTAVFGNEFWTSNSVGGLTYAQVLLCSSFLAGVFTLGSNVVNVALHTVRHPEESGDMYPPHITLLPNLLMLVSVGALASEYPAYFHGPGFRTVCCAYGMAVGNVCPRHPSPCPRPHVTTCLILFLFFCESPLRRSTTYALQSCGRFVISRVCSTLKELRPALELPTIGFPIAAFLFVVVCTLKTVLADTHTHTHTHTHTPLHTQVPKCLGDSDVSARFATKLPEFMDYYLYTLCAMYLHLALSVCERIGKVCYASDPTPRKGDPKKEGKNQHKQTRK